jgi:hypothetical protein
VEVDSAVAAVEHEWVVVEAAGAEAEAVEEAGARYALRLDRTEDEMISSRDVKIRRIKQIAIFTMSVFAALLIFADIRYLVAQAAQDQYSSPQEAVQSLVSAAKADDVNRLMSIFGPTAKEILHSGDEVADKETREKFLEKYKEMNRLTANPDGSVTLYIGAENWPFPIPLVKKNGSWQFSTAAGKREILYRRIGRNEFNTIDTLRALVDAQKEYASEPRDGGQVKHYAQKLLSDEGKHNGLYWKAGEGQPSSPVGPLIANAFSEGYRKQEGSTPYHGYIYRVLRSQGPSAPGGARDYMVNGELTRGFAFVAYPAEYRNSGVMTFIVNQDGKVYQKDLGTNTKAIASAMTAYNPDKTWQVAEAYGDQ